MKYVYGKNVFITGGSSGIGLATAQLLAANGYTVYAGSRNPASVIRTFEGGGEIHPVFIDVRDNDSVEKAVRSIIKQADIGILIHCAGIGIACPGEEYPEDAVNNLLNTNYHGVLRVNSHFLKHLRSRERSLCVIIGSVAGVIPIPYQSHYCASKAALDLYARSLRTELRSFGVRVSLLMPGDTKTGFTGARKYEVDKSSPFYEACIRATAVMERDEDTGYSPDTAAKAVFDLCRTKKPTARKTVGFKYKFIVLMQRLLPDRVLEFLIGKMYL